MSRTRLKNLTKRLKCNEILKEYNEIFCDYVKNGKIERVLKGEIVKSLSVH